MNEPNRFAASSVITSSEVALVAAPTYVSNGVSPAVISSLSGAKPWIQFLAIIGYLASAFGMLMALVMWYSLTQIRSLQNSLGNPSDSAITPISLIVAICGGALLAAICGIIFSTLLVRLASAINRFRYSGDTTFLEQAMERSRKCWKFAGIMAILGVVSFTVMIALSIRSQRERQQSRILSPTVEQVERGQ